STSRMVFTPASLTKVGPLHYPLIMRLALDLLRSLRGDDVLRVIELVKMWGMEPYLYATVKHGSRGKRIQALTLLSSFDDEASYRVLLDHAGNPDMYIQVSALRGLSMRAPVSDLMDIIDRVTRSGGGMNNSLMLADILRRFGVPVVPALIGLVQSDAEHEVRLAGVMALGMIGDRSALDALIELSQEEGSMLRSAAITAMAQIGDDKAAYAVAALLESDSTPIRIQCAEALGKLKVTGTLPDLVVRLTDREWWVRFRAAEAICKFSDIGLAALRAMGQQDDEAGVIARQVLGELVGVA
ncbi:MAG: HEAT repeat domain-containing protein, partial [Aquabacterium sp.]|nr:HEAT repeat domain-containing protein [Aquabacterium sp.]